MYKVYSTPLNPVTYQLTRRFVNFTTSFMSSTSFVNAAIAQKSLVPTDRDHLQRLADQFDQVFDHPAKAVLMAPGRVNLIGEHIDYEGYSVLPMAITKRIYIAVSDHCSKCKEAHCCCPCITVHNTSANYEPTTVSAADYQDERKIMHASPSVAYFLCGYRGLLRSRGLSVTDTCLSVLIEGEIPAACGLSSSSALVVASALATAAVCDPKTVPTRLEMAEICRKAEHAIGTMGGGMDQAICCLGSAQHVTFDPLSSKPVQMPHGVALVVANSLQKAHKAVDAAKYFNKRVVECALASKVLAKHLGHANWRNIRTLRQVQEASRAARTDATLAHMLTKVEQCFGGKNAFTVDEICALLDEAKGKPSETLVETLFGADGSNIEQVKKVFAASTSFQLRARALHVYGEAQRVQCFASTCSEASLADKDKARALGELMNSSHDSCQRLYECSSDGLDELCGIATKAGALGARMTGAGWGGCMITLVANDKAPTLIDSMRAEYYRKHQLDDTNALFVTQVADGAAIFMQ